MRDEVNDIFIKELVFNPSANAGWERKVAFTNPFNESGSLTGTGSTADETILSGSAVSSGQEYLITNMVFGASSADTVAVVSGSSTIGYFQVPTSGLVIPGGVDNILGKVSAGDAISVVAVNGAGTNETYTASISGMIRPSHSSLETL